MTAALPIERRAAAGVTANGRTLSGHAAIYDSPTNIMGYTERIAPGAFTRTLASGNDVLCLLDHRSEVLLGRTKSGSLKLSEDSKGLRFELQLPNTSAANDVVALAERSDLGGMSFGFIVEDESWAGDTRTLNQIDLHEISVVQAHAAYSQTEINLRNKPFDMDHFREINGIANSPTYLWLRTI